MSSIGTFGSYTQARLGIYAAQAGLSVTGNNIANINTHGYTRQKLDQTSFYAGGSDRYYSSTDMRVGNGVLCTGVSQLRDPYLDIRFRNQNANVGAMDAKLAGLENIQRIIDEVGEGKDDFGIISAQLSDFFKQLQQLSDQPGQQEYDVQVRSSAEALVKQFNSYAAQLQEVQKNADKAFRQDVDVINNILTNIRDLNSTIRKAEIHGDGALELRDQRNILIDQLSSYMKIDVLYGEEEIGGSVKVEKLTIRLADANPDPNSTTDSTTLIDGVYGAQIGITQIPKKNPAYDPTVPGSFPYLDPDGNAVEKAEDAMLVDDPNYGITVDALKDSKDRVLRTRVGDAMVDSAPVELQDNDLYGALQAQREMLTEAGEFTSTDTVADVDPNAATKRGIPFYQKALDLLANQFATVFNEANQGYLRNSKNEYVTADGDPIMDDDGVTPLTTDMDLTDDQKLILEAQGVHKGTPLFSNRGDGNETENITASNISISFDWSKGPQIINSFVKEGSLDVGSTDNSNILHMLSLMSTKLEYDPSVINPDAADTPMFTGDFNEMWINIGSILGNDIRSTTTMLDTYHAAAVELDVGRESVSGVDLNDEAMNLMQYSKSYNAACRLMTTIDSVLDKLINGTAV